MAIMNTRDFPKQLDRDVDKMFFDEYTRYPSMYEKLFEIENFPSGGKYSVATLSGLGALQTLAEGAGVAFDEAAEGNAKEVTPEEFGLAVQITRNMMEDDHHGKVKQLAQRLAHSANHRKELEAADVFINGNDSTKQTAYDGKALFANDHTTLKSGDTIDNLATAALSETSLQAAFDYFNELVDEQGFPIVAKPKYLVVPTNLRWMAKRLKMQDGGITPLDGSSGTIEYDGSTGMSSSGNMSGNDMTTNPANGYVDDWQVAVWRYLDASLGGDDNNWYLCGDVSDTLKYLWQRKATLESGDDFLTGSALFKLTMRLRAAAFNYRGIYGAVVA